MKTGCIALLVCACATAMHAQTSEQVGRLELSNGYVSVEARGDGLMTVAVVGILHFDVGSGVFSPRTTNAWLSRVTAIVDSLRTRSRSAIGESPELLAATGDTRLRFTFELAARPALSSVHLLRADLVEIGLSAVAGDTAFDALIHLLRVGADRTLALTLASPDSARAYMSDMELTDRVPKAEIVVKSGKTPWAAADRLFVTFAASSLSGLGLSYGNHAATVCTSPLGYCRWQLANNGFTAGSIVGSSLASLALTRGGDCSLGTRALRVAGISTLAALPGAVLAQSGKQTALAITPTLQAIALDIALRPCRVPAAKRPTSRRAR